MIKVLGAWWYGTIGIVKVFNGYEEWLDDEFYSGYINLEPTDRKVTEMDD